MSKIYPYPTDAIERNNLRRIISFDRSFGNGHMLFIEACREEDAKLGRYRLYLYPVDVLDDNIGISQFLPVGRKSESLKIKHTQVVELVDVPYYVEVPEWSAAWKVVAIFPPNSSRLPGGFANGNSEAHTAFFNVLSSEISSRRMRKGDIEFMEQDIQHKEKRMQEGTLKVASDAVAFGTMLKGDQHEQEKPSVEQKSEKF